MRASRCFPISLLVALSACAASGSADEENSRADAAVTISAAQADETRSLPGAETPSPEECSGSTTSEADSEACEPRDEGEEKIPLIDRTQQKVYGVVQGSSLWFDSFFGTTENDQGGNVRQGSVRLGTRWDERDGTRIRARLKARVPLPAFKERTRLILGRGDAEELVDGSTLDNTDSLPGQFNDFEDDDWLLGVGYSKDGTLTRGFDVGAGVKLATPLEPYIRLTYRWNHTFNDAWLWQLRPRVFWQNQRGPGASINSVLDYAVNPTWLLRSWIILSGEDAVEGLGWTNNFIAYQSLNNKSALSYRLFAAGETDSEVPLQDYGFELRYRRRIARDYLFLELSTSVTWPRYLLEETRDSNIGVGIEFEMQFGDWPGRKQADLAAMNRFAPDRKSAAGATRSLYERRYRAESCCMIPPHLQDAL